MLRPMADLLTRMSVVHPQTLLWALFGWIDHASYKSRHLVSYGKACSRPLSWICYHRAQSAGGLVSYETSSH